MLHWHGIRIDNAMDGSPLTQNPVEPGETFDYVFAALRTPAPTGTTPMSGSSRQVEQGLYGALIVAEERPPADTGELDSWCWMTGIIND